MSGLRLPLHVETMGADPRPGVDTFLLLHGYGGSSFTWRYWAHRLAQRGHVVLVDMKGFGSAPKPDDGRYGPHDLADLIHLLVLQRDLTGVTLVGHSLGGAVALLAGLRLLDDGDGRLARLVIVSGAAYAQKLPPFVSIARVPGLGPALLRLLGPALVVRQVLRSIVYDPRGVTRAQVEGYAEPLGHADARRALVDVARQIVPANMEEAIGRYPEIRVPTLALWGRQDRVVPLWIGEQLQRDLPRAELVVLENCGHLPPEELPDESWEAVAAFLDANPLSRTNV